MIGYAPDGFSGAARCARHRSAPHATARTRRPVLEERQGPRLRQVPRPADVPDPRSPRPRDRVRRPRARSRGLAEIPQLARDRAVPQGPRAVRAVAGEAGEPEARAAGRGRGLHGRGRAGAIRRDPGGGDARHRDHARPRRTAVPQRARRLLLLRRRSRRPQRRVESAGIGAAADEGRPPGAVPVPARRRGSGHASCARKAPTGFDARLREAMPLSEFFFAEMSART